MTLLIVLSHRPYDGTDVAWNALRLVETAQGAGGPVRLFLINDGVDAARAPGETVEHDVGAMVTAAAGRGAEVAVCGTCIDRCGIGTGDLVEGAQRGSMDQLVDWIATSDKVISF